MSDKRENNGGSRKGAGRKPKTDEHQLIEKLSPLSQDAYHALTTALKDKQGWAVKLFFEYMYGKPKQQMDINANVEAFNIINLGNGIDPDETTT